MRIIVLGGAGDMASRAVRELAAEPEVAAITVADCNVKAAAQLATELGDKVSAVAVDANDHEPLVEVIRGHAVAASGIGPFLDELERRGVTVQDMTGQWPEAVAVPAGPSPLAFALAALGVWLLIRRLRRR